jgi:hypothetical protein
MATGDVKWFADALVALGKKQFDLSADVLKLGITTNAVVPTIGTAVPHWGGTGTTNAAANQVATTGTSYTGPITLTNVTFADVGRTGPKLRADILTLAQDASGFTNGAYGWIFDNTDANKRCLGYVELSSAGTASLVAGQVQIDWNGATNDILTLTAS